MNLPPSGRRVLVSGASRGLGRAVAQAFAANGDRVAVHYGTRADEARETLESLAGDGHVLTGGDLADPAGAAAVADAAAEAPHRAPLTPSPRSRRTGPPSHCPESPHPPRREAGAAGGPGAGRRPRARQGFGKGRGGGITPSTSP